MQSDWDAIGNGQVEQEAPELDPSVASQSKQKVFSLENDLAKIDANLEVRDCLQQAIWLQVLVNCTTRGLPSDS